MKQYQYKITGMNQDSAYQVFNPDKAFSCTNMRFFRPEDDMSLLKISNERGNKPIENIYHVLNEGRENPLYNADNTQVKIWGVCEIPNNYIIFASYTYNSITRSILVSKNGLLEPDTDSILEFTNEIQSICVQENDELIKVYFTDGEHTVQVLNVTELTKSDTGNVTNKLFELLSDFLKAEVSVTKSYGGRFHSGMIQYAFTYANDSLQETNIWHVTPLYVVGDNNQGSSADDICNVSFKINIDHPDNYYDYLCVYGILRTSLDAEPQVYTLDYIKISGASISFVDTGANWIGYNASELVLKQRERFIAKYMTQYNNRLFLGNFKLIDSELDLTNADTLAYINYVKNSLRIEHINPDLDNARDNMTFRSNEWYRFGIQFTNKYGSVSKVYYLDDILMDTLDPVSMVLTKKTIKAALPSTAFGVGDYTHARLMMVDRTMLPHRTLCQGVLCPTVYRVQDRVDNLPFSMSSWSMRGINTNYRSVGFPTSGPDVPLLPNTNKRTGELQNQQDWDHVTDSDYSNPSVDLPPMLVRDWSYTGDGNKYVALIRYNYSPASDASLPLYAGSSLSYKLYIADNDNVYSSNHNGLTDNTCVVDITIDTATMVANNLRTLNDCIDDFEIRMYNQIASDSRFRYPRRLVDLLVAQYRVGYPSSTLNDNLWGFATSFPFTSNPNSPVYDGDGTMTIENAHQAAYNLPSKPFISDHNIITFHSPDAEKYGDIVDNNKNIRCRIIGYSEMESHVFDYYMDVTAPKDATSVDALQPIEKNKDRVIYNAYLWGSHGYKFPVFIWNRTQALNSQVEAGDYEDNTWYSQVIKKIMCNKHFCGTVTGFSKRENPTDTPIYFEGVDSVETPYHDTPVFPKIGTPRFFNSNEVTGLSLEKQNNSLNIMGDEVYQGNVDLMHSSPFDIPIKAVNSDNTVIFHPNGGDPITCADAIWMRYKSTPHIVMPLSFVACDDYMLAPSLPALLGAYNSYTPGHGAYMWSDNVHGFLRSTIGSYVKNFDSSDYKEILYVAELYLNLSADDIYPNPDSSMQLWVPISDWGDMNAGNIGAELIGYGDTYLGNWDCLKTYAFSEDDIQQYKDVTSITLESDNNPVGRYDKFKDSDSVLHASNINFNLYNSVYNQKDNLFTYRDTQKELKTFSSQLFYSQVKTLGEKVDTWCQVSPISVLDTEGVKGEITGLISNNSGVYVFQEHAVSKIHSNTRVAIPTSDGLPITLGNNNQVDEPQLLSTNYGTEDIKFVKKLDDVIYFVNNDSYFDLVSIGENDAMINLSMTHGMHSYMKHHNAEALYPTKPERLLADNEMKELYIQIQDDSLCYNSLMQGFTSYYNYGKYNHLFEYDNYIYGLTDDSVWQQRTGSYNNFFGSYKSYGITIIANMEPLDVKTFSNIEYNMDSTVPVYDGATNSYHPVETEATFNYIAVEDSYQKGANDIAWDKYNPSLLKRKLRVWRVDIPRQSNSLDRITDTWCKIELWRKPHDGIRKDINSGINYINVTYYKK